MRAGWLAPRAAAGLCSGRPRAPASGGCAGGGSGTGRRCSGAVRSARPGPARPGPVPLRSGGQGRLQGGWRRPAGERRRAGRQARREEPLERGSECCCFSAGSGRSAVRGPAVAGGGRASCRRALARAGAGAAAVTSRKRVRRCLGACGTPLDVEGCAVRPARPVPLQPRAPPPPPPAAPAAGEGPRPRPGGSGPERRAGRGQRSGCSRAEVSAGREPRPRGLRLSEEGCVVATVVRKRLGTNWWPPSVGARLRSRHF